jgi:2-methylcitrate dehydratase PrpD
MQTSIAEKLAHFVSGTDFGDLPEDVILESKRILLDSLGCAIAGGNDTKGRIAIEYARIIGAGQRDATIFGASHRSSIFGAAFANGELINALDFDAILPPGHVSPYVLPGALAVAEVDGVTGRALVRAIAVAHEMSNRFGKAMDYIRDTVDGKYTMPAVLGYNSTIFGATAAIMQLREASPEMTAHALSIAASITPVNSHRSWIEHTPVSTIKYTMAGPITQTALTAAHMALLGHRGDPRVFDDAEFGYRRFIGSTRWSPEKLTVDLGKSWRFQRENSFKLYPHCRAPHGLIDLLGGILDENALNATEIEAIRAWGEGHVDRPCWTVSEINDPVEAQFSTAHGLAVAAQRLPSSKVWQSREVVFAPQVLDLMRKVSYQIHPDWASSIASDPAARPSRIEVDARGRTFVAELRYPRGTPGAAGGVAMTDQELTDKFRTNADGIIPPHTVEDAISSIMDLESVDDVSELLKSLGASEH